jgi:hypothetical protein
MLPPGPAIPRKSVAGGLHTETKIDRICQNSGDISQKRLDFQLSF